jgi:hypothetical protein
LRVEVQPLCGKCISDKIETEVEVEEMNRRF